MKLPEMHFSAALPNDTENEWMRYGRLDVQGLIVQSLISRGNIFSLGTKQERKVFTSSEADNL